jgi:hypothetical protein
MIQRDTHEPTDIDYLAFSDNHNASCRLPYTNRRLLMATAFADADTFPPITSHHCAGQVSQLQTLELMATLTLPLVNLTMPIVYKTVEPTSFAQTSPYGQQFGVYAQTVVVFSDCGRWYASYTFSDFPRTNDVTCDGKRFLLDTTSVGSRSALNWDAGLKK